MKRGPLGPGSRGRDERRRGRKHPTAQEGTASGTTDDPKSGDRSGSPGSPDGPSRQRVHEGRPLVIASIHRDTSELQELARTLGLRLVLQVWQNRNRPHPGTFLGRGKLERLRGWLDEWKAGLRPREWTWTGDHWVPGSDVGREEAGPPTSWGGWDPGESRASGTEGRGGQADGEPSIADLAGRDMLLVVDEDVRPAVLFNLEEQLGVEAWGRTRLILEIFSQHAHLKEARLQVELAQLRYDVPMVHEAIHRKRRGERPGFMGGGEYAVADYEDFIKRRMRTIREELRRVRHDRAVRRKVRRDRFYLVSLAGYTNAGKSSLLSAMTGAEAVQESTLFSTLGTMTRRLELPGQRAGPGGRAPATDEEDPLASFRRPILVTDTVGFIRALPSWLLEAFHATLEEIALADVVLLTADASDPEPVLLDKIRVGMSELAHLDVTCPILLVLNKTDLVSKAELRAKTRLVIEATTVRPEWILGVSAMRKEGLGQLVGLIQSCLPEMVAYRLRVSGADQGQRLLGRLQGWGVIEHVDYGPVLHVEGLCDPIFWKELQREARETGVRVERKA